MYIYHRTPQRERERGGYIATRRGVHYVALSPTAVAVVVHAKSVLAQLCYWNLIPNSRDASRYPRPSDAIALPSFSLLQLLLLILRSSFPFFFLVAAWCCAAAPNSRASLCMRAFTRTFNKWPRHSPHHFSFLLFFFSHKSFSFYFSPHRTGDLLFDISKRQKWQMDESKFENFSESRCARKIEKTSDERFLVFCFLFVFFFFPSLNFEWHYQEKLYISLLNRSGGSPGV